MADRLAAGIAYHIRADAIRGLRYGQGDLFCKVCGDQPDLFHLHCLIQQVNMCRFAILRLCPIDPPGVFNLPIYGLDGSIPLSLVSVCFFIPIPCQLIIIVFQYRLGDQPAQLANISKNFLLQGLERYQLFFYNRFHHAVSFTCFVSQLTS